MKKYIYLVIAIFLMFSLLSCNFGKQSNGSDDETSDITRGTEYILLDNGNIIAPDGTEYVYLANEGFVEVFGSTAFLSKLKGEKATLDHMGFDTKTGMYSCEADSDQNVLKRIIPDNEWAVYYRKASLPKIDLSINNCIRLELIGYREINRGENFSPDIKHMSCDGGINNPDEIQDFLKDIRSQKSPEKAGLYDLVENPDGMLENCYEYGIVYGYFKDEVNLAIPLHVTSYNDKAYSISFTDKNFNDKEYVLPQKWLSMLKEK